MPHIELPVQAGSDKVLKDMNRGYSSADYRRVVQEIRDLMPEVTINTDIIVGFPGESEEEFEDTFRLLEELRLDKVHLAKYSVRPKTIAARKMEDDVSAKEKERRRLRIETLADQILEEKNEAYQDTEVEVLVEGKVKDRWRGRTPCNRLVFFEYPENLTGALVDVRIEWTGPYSLRGQHVSTKVAPLPPKVDLSLESSL